MTIETLIDMLPQGRRNPATADLTGTAINSWTVLCWVRRTDQGKQIWLCRCGCGVEREVEGYNLTSGRSQSCRKCSAKVVGATVHKTHGMSEHVVYKRWQAMKTRCTNPKAKDWDNYGGRGITVAPEWLDDFMAFYVHIGDPPTELHTVDREDPWGHYEPGNVRWATPAEQMQNTRRAAKYADRREAEAAEMRAGKR